MFNIKPSIGDLLRSSFRSILKNKGRTVLTSLGIIIGVTSVILLTSIGNGLKIFINQQFESLGSNTVFISPGKVFNDNGGFNSSESSRIVTTNFTQKNVDDLSRRFRNFDVIPMAMAQVTMKSPSTTKKNISIIGTDHRYGPVTNNAPTVQNGRWFTKEENDKETKVIILGNKLATDLFPSGNALGKKVIINGKNMKVIGINDSKGSSFGGPSFDDYAYAPIGIVQSFVGNKNIVEIIVKTDTKDQVAQTKIDIEKLLLKTYDKDAFTVFDSSQLLNSINTIISTLTVALTGIAAISLVVGGIGIMNIMLVTVTERTREIGLRKAIGAYPRAILLQFLFEAVILSAFGGLIGIILGTLGTMAINNFFPAKVTALSILLAFGVSSLVGIIFGVTPARRASKLSPIEALRYE